MSMLNEKACRICLIKNGTVSVFGKHNNKSLADMIENCANVTIAKGDGLLESLCIECIDRVENAFTFKLECEKSYKIMKNYFGFEDVFTDIKICESDFVDIKKKDTINELLVEDLIENNNEKINIEDLKIVLKYENCKEKKSEAVNSSKNNIFLDSQCNEPFNSNSSPKLSDSMDIGTNKVNILKWKTECTTKKHLNEHEQKLEIKIVNLEDIFNENNDIDFPDVTDISDKIEDDSSIINSTINIKNTKGNNKTLQYKCEYCEETFCKKIRFHTHLKIHYDQFNCKLCSKFFDSHFKYKRHLEQHKTVKCNICFKLLEKRSLYEHQKTHKEFTCEFCSKQFSFFSKLKRHILTHNKIEYERPYKCDVCNKTFHYNNALTIHFRTHTGERPYQCTYCPKSFSYKCSLSGHIKIHTGSQKYQCSICDKKFCQPSLLDMHKRIHANDRPFACDFCEMRFLSKSHLTVHRRTHTGDKPYECSVCAKRFCTSCRLKRHQKIHLSN